MAGDDVEQHGEIRRTRGVAVWVLVLGVAALVALLVWAGSDDAPSEAAPSTTATSAPSTLPRPLPVLHVVADTDTGPRPATTASAPGDGAASVPFEAIQATPITTDGRVVLLVDGGAVLVGRPGGGFGAIDLGLPTAALVASNEPGHVWVVAPRDELALVDLDGIDPPVRIPLDGDRVLGLGTFGVVTVGDEGTVSWRRQSFDPTPVAVPPGRTALDAGGGSVLVERPRGGDGERVFEVLTVAEGALVGGFRGESDRPAALSPDGATVALPSVEGWSIHDVRSLAVRGSLPAAAGDPVWVGEDRWAILTDGVASLSDGTTLSPPWRLRALAEQSP